MDLSPQVSTVWNKARERQYWVYYTHTHRTTYYEGIIFLYYHKLFQIFSFRESGENQIEKADEVLQKVR